MTYVVDVHPPASAQVEALPIDAARRLAEVFVVLELTPWVGRPLVEGRPEAPTRCPMLGTGMVVYLILEDQRIVDVLDVQWLDLGPASR